MNINPITRIEKFLSGIINGDGVPDAITRIEHYLKAIFSNQVCSIPPVTRIEYYLAKISGADVEIPSPLTRIETYLANIAGLDIQVPNPITRLEYFFADWVEASQSTAIASGTSPLSLLNALAKPIKKLLQHGKLSVSGTDVTCNNGTLKFGALGKNLSPVSEFSPNPYTFWGTGMSRLEAVINSLPTGQYTISQKFEIVTLPENGKVAHGPVYVTALVDGSQVNVNTFSSQTDDEPYIGKVYTEAATITITEELQGNINHCYFYCDQASTHTGSGRGTYNLYDIQIEKGDQATPYEPYTEGIYADGTPEEIVVSAAGAEDQTANAENLFAVGDIEDTQDIITGKVTRRTEAVVSDGTPPTGRYVGTVGEGNIIVKAREDGYTGEIVSFETEEETPLTGLIVEMEPQQDLHGYDKPWPPGGNVQLFDKDDSTLFVPLLYLNASSGVTDMLYDSAENKQRTVVIPCKSSTTYTISNGITTTLRVASFNTKPDAAGITPGAANSPSGQTSSGTGLTLTTGANDVWLAVQVIANADVSGGTTFEAAIAKLMVQTGSSVSAWSPYSNICPISGWTGVTVYDTGVNVWDEETELGSLDTTTGLPTPVTTQIRAKNFVPVVGGETYRVVTTDSPNGIWMLFYDNNKQVITKGLPSVGTTSNNARRVPNGYTVPMPSNCAYVRWYFQIAYGTTYNNDTALNYPSTDTEYHAYNGKHLSVTFGALGKNKFNPAEAQNNKWINGTTGAIETANGYWITGFIPVKKDDVIRCPDKGSIRCAWYNADKSEATYFIFGGGNSSATAPEDGFAVLTVFGNTIAIGGQFIVTINNADLTYEPYNDTIYSGYFDFVNGELVGDDVKLKLLSTFAWQMDGTTGSDKRFGFPYSSNPSIKQAVNTNGIYISDILAPWNIGLNSHEFGTFYISSSWIVVQDKNSHFATLDDFKDWLDSEDVYLVYKIATPLRWKLSPTAIETLQGLNNVWSNAKSVKVYVSNGEVIVQVTPQKLSTAEGDNTITVTAEVSDIVLDAEYRVASE